MDSTSAKTATDNIFRWDRKFYLQEKRYFLNYVQKQITSNYNYYINENSTSLFDEILINGVNINVVIGNKSCRSEIYINTGNKDENKRIFDFYYSYRKKIEKFIKDLTWERLDDKNTCRIKIEKPLSFRNSDDCEKIFNFFVTSTEQYLKVFAPYSSKYKNNNILEFPNLFFPSTGLCVFLPDGNVIQEKKACDTFIKAILLAGVHKVRKLGYTYCRVPIVSNTKDRKYGSAQHPIGGGLYILTHSNSKDKKRILDRISEELNLNWRVEIIE